MQIQISLIWIPVILTLIGLGLMFRPYKSTGSYDFGDIFRVLWSIPIMFSWMVYAFLT